MKRKLLSIVLALAMTASLSGCGGEKAQESAASNGEAKASEEAEPSSEAAVEEPASEAAAETEEAVSGEAEGEAKHLSIAYQYSIAYAPLIIMKEYDLISKHYSGKVETEWNMLNSGSAINEGVIAGDIDVGAMGVAPVITGIKAGIPYKVFSGISSQPYDVMTNSDKIKKLSDIGPEDKISVVALNSLPHILLAMAAKEELGDSHALDQNLVAMSNGDGMTALISGAVQCQMCISPYNLMEQETEGLHRVEVPDTAWPSGDTFIVGVAATSLHDNDPELYQALCDAMKEAIDIVNEKPAEVAELLSKDFDATKEDVLKWLSDSRSSYDIGTKGVVKLGEFMSSEGFLESEAPSYEEVVFDNVKGD